MIERSLTSKLADRKHEQARFTAWAFVLLLTFVAQFMGAQSTWSQQPPPPSPSGRPVPPQSDSLGIADHIGEIRRRLGEIQATGNDSEMLIDEARRNLDGAEQKMRANDLFVAGRLVAASDAFSHAAEHPQRLQDGPRGPVPVARPPEIAAHLQHIYFRLQEADYFAQASRDRNAKGFPGLARKFYEQALQRYDRGNWLAADEYAKASDDTIRGLENLAQAAAPMPSRPR